MRVSDGGERPGVAGEATTTSEVALDEERRMPSLEDVYLSAATEDPAWSLKATACE